MKRQRVGPSLVQDVEFQLREEILLGLREPGEKLLAQPLSQRLAVSLSVVREALTRLAEQGLVKSAPQIGFTVTSLSVRDLEDLTRVRVDIETLMISRAVVEGDLAWETAVVGTHHALANTPPHTEEGRMNPAWRSGHSAFHSAVASGCDSPLLQGFRAALYDKSELYRAWAVRASEQRDIVAEHRAICDAVIKRDAAQAIELMTAHLRLTTKLLLEFVQEPAGQPAV